MTNLLSNPGFEGLSRPGGYTHDTHTGEVHGNFVTPEGWIGWWDEREGRRRPETKVIQLVPPFIGPPCRIDTGDWASLMVVSYHAWAGGYYQILDDLEIGAEYVAGFSAHAWCNHEGLPHDGEANCAPVGCGPLYRLESDLPPQNEDPVNDAWYAALFQVGVQFLQPGQKPDPTYGVIWGDAAAIYNAYHQVPPLRFRAISERLALLTRGDLRWDYRNNDGYVDTAYLEPEEAPPSRPYERTYVLLPPDVTLPEAHEVLDEHFDDRQTVGFSADDAGMDAPNLTLRGVIAYRPEAWPGDLPQFFDSYYPGLDIYEEREMPGSPPPPPEAWACASLHLQSMMPGVKAFLQMTQVGAIKRVTGMQDCITLQEWGPSTAVVYRHHGDQRGYLDRGDPQGRITPLALEAGRDWIAQFYDSLVSVCASGMWSASRPLYIEEWNELGWDAGNIDWIQRNVSIDRSFIVELMKLGLPVAPVSFCAGVGNIGREGQEEQDFLMLVDLARETAAAGGAFGLHSYWTPGMLEQGWKYLAGRYQWIDEVLVANGVKVDWILGECGVAGLKGAPKPQSRPGWRDPASHNGDWDAYLAEIVEFDRRLRLWNMDHEGRVLGALHFTTGSMNTWPDFELKTEQILSLAAALS